MLLVTFHIYYTDQIPWFAERLENIRNVDWTLVVTFSEENERDFAILRRIKPDAVFVKVENRGYDIWPFFQAVRSVDMSRYDSILKLHTKNTDSEKMYVNRRMMDGLEWRERLVDDIVGSCARFEASMKKLSRKKVGMVCSLDLLTRIDTCLEEDNGGLEDALRRYGFKTGRRLFCAGTMFLAKTDALQPFLSINPGADDFDNVGASHSSGSLSHVFERLISLSVYEAGYTIATMVWERPVRKRLARLLSYALKWLFSLDRTGREHEKFLTVFGFRFKVASGDLDKYRN